MSNSNYDLTTKFFHPPQRTVSCHNGLLNTRTKNIIAQDRATVAEQRILDIERRKSASNLQLLAFAQKQFEKKLSLRVASDQSLQTRKRSISDAVDRRMAQWHDTLETKYYESLNSSHSNLLFPPKIENLQRGFSSYSDEDIVENRLSPSEAETDGEEESNEALNSKEKHSIQPPIVAVIPPEEDISVLIQ